MDHILVRQKDNGLFRAYRAHRGAEAAVNTDHVLVAASISAVPDPNVRTDEPAVDEDTRAINKLKNARDAAWFRWYSPELLKCTICPISRALHSLFTRYLSLEIWHSHCYWQEGIIITLYKGKFINSRFCAWAVKVLLKIAGNATKCSTFEVHYHKSTSLRSTAVRYLEHR